MEKMTSWRNHPQIALILKATSYLMGEKFLRLFVGLVLQTWMARYLGPERYGQFSYISDFVAVFFPLITFGIDDLLIKDLVQKRIPQEKILGSILFLRMINSLVAWFFVGVGIVYARGEKPWIVMATIAYASVLLVKAFETSDTYFVAHYDMKTVTVSRNIGYFTSSALKVMAILAKLNVGFFLFAFYMDYLIGRIYSGVRLLKTFSIKDLKVDKTYLRLIVLSCLPIALNGFLIILENRSGIFLLNKYTNEETVGQYAVGLSLINLWEFFPGAVCLVLYPSIIKSKEYGKEKYEQRNVELQAIIFLMTSAFIAFCFLFSPFIIKILYGDKYHLAQEVLAVGSLSLFFTSFNFSRIKWFIMEEKTWHWFYLSLAIFFLNVIFQTKFDIQYKHLGPIYSSILAYALANLMGACISPTIRANLKIILKGMVHPLAFARRMSKR